ncbi:hypothetical protein [Actinoplanes sp. G11-F43]|uniref:hypothetical protein n=1 Tax=Actinoplanes sp. G11-F43 TaxID=3424130 RepID=UPI003D345BCE
MPQDFNPALRGYEMRKVDAVLDRAVKALASGSPSQRASAQAALRAADFPIALRGYVRDEVDDAVRELLRQFGEHDLRETLGSVLRLTEPTDESIVDEVRRLRELADRHDR